MAQALTAGAYVAQVWITTEVRYEVPLHCRYITKSSHAAQNQHTFHIQPPVSAVPAAIPMLHMLAHPNFKQHGVVRWDGEELAHNITSVSLHKICRISRSHQILLSQMGTSGCAELFPRSHHPRDL